MPWTRTGPAGRVRTFIFVAPLTDFSNELAIPRRREPGRRIRGGTAFEPVSRGLNQQRAEATITSGRTRWWDPGNSWPRSEGFYQVFGRLVVRMIDAGVVAVAGFRDRGRDFSWSGWAGLSRMGLRRHGVRERRCFKGPRDRALSGDRGWLRTNGRGGNRRQRAGCFCKSQQIADGGQQTGQRDAARSKKSSTACMLHQIAGSGG